MKNRKIYFYALVITWISCLYLLIIEISSYISCQSMSHSLDYDSCLMWKANDLDKFEIINLLFIISLLYILASIIIFIIDLFKFALDKFKNKFLNKK